MIDDTIKAYEDMGRCISIRVPVEKVDRMRKDPIWRYFKLDASPHWKHLKKFTQDAFLYPLEGVIGIAKVSYQVTVYDERAPHGRTFIENSNWEIMTVGIIDCSPVGEASYWMVDLGKEVD